MNLSNLSSKFSVPHLSNLNWVLMILIMMFFFFMVFSKTKKSRYHNF